MKDEKMVMGGPPDLKPAPKKTGKIVLVASVVVVLIALIFVWKKKSPPPTVVEPPTPIAKKPIPVEDTRTAAVVTPTPVEETPIIDEPEVPMPVEEDTSITAKLEEPTVAEEIQPPSDETLTSVEEAPTLKTPTSEAIATPIEDKNVHVVEKGEYLWLIAGYSNVYSNPSRWTEIYNANIDKIENPDLIYPGQVLIIP